jgi:hypothetical protein
MPPWKPSPGFGTFQGERRLTDREIATLAAWAEGSAPEGDSTSLPPAPMFAARWQLGKPDLVITLPAYALRPDGLDVFRNFVVPIPGRDTRFVRGFEFRAGSPAVHHANIRIDPTAASRRMDDLETPRPATRG